MRIIKHLVTISMFLFFTPMALAKNLPTEQTPLNTMLAQTMPSVVNIQVERKIPAYVQNMLQPQQKSKLASIGSGVIIDAKNGFIVTNAHVLKDEKLITVTLKDSRKFTAKLIGMDTGSDIGVIQIEADDLSAMPLANSNNVRVGDFVAAVGSPFGLDQTVTSGIVSALGRSDSRRGNVDSYIQTDASINLGNSGGALINMQGELIGINSAILTPETGNVGIGFAIPSNTINLIVHQLITFGAVKRGYMGVLVQDLTPALADTLNMKSQTGALVSIVNQHSPAALAGITTGDIIIAVDNEAVHSAAQLISNVAVLRAGTSIKLDIIHNGKQQDARINLQSEELIMATRERANPYFYSTSMRDYSELNANFGYIQGIQILTVANDSNASRDGILPGDIIVSANLNVVTNIESLQKIIDKLHDKPLLLNVLRQGGAFFITLKPSDGKPKAA